MISVPEKPAPLSVQSVITEVENLPFEPLTLDTIAEAPFTNSPPTTSGAFIIIHITSSILRYSAYY